MIDVHQKQVSNSIQVLDLVFVQITNDHGHTECLAGKFYLPRMKALGTKPPGLRFLRLCLVGLVKLQLKNRMPRRPVISHLACQVRVNLPALMSRN